MASAQQMMRGNVLPADHAKRPAPEMMKSAHIVYNFSQPQMNYHQVDPQMQRQYSYDMQTATAMHYNNANDQSKKMRIEVHDS
jgi:hypothetical protein